MRSEIAITVYKRFYTVQNGSLEFNKSGKVIKISKLDAYFSLLLTVETPFSVA